MIDSMTENSVCMCAKPIEEEITEAQLEKLNYNLDKLTGLYLGMKEIDSTGAFENDDEVGSTFTDLKNLIEKNLKDLEHYYTEADRIEDEGDRIHRRITATLFSGQFDAMEVLRIEGVINLFEDSLDEMARVARVIRTISLKES
mgnify:CR=1 FL=1